MLGIGRVVVAGNRKQVARKQAARKQAAGGNGVAGWGKAVVEARLQDTEHCQ